MKVKVTLKDNFNEVMTENVTLNRNGGDTECEVDLSKDEIKALEDTEAVDIEAKSSSLKKKNQTKR